MRTWERLRKAREFFYNELCVGREFKAPVFKGNNRHAPDITDFTMAEPRVFIGFQPTKPNMPGDILSTDPYSVCPALTIMPNPGYARYVQEHRFDRYQNIHRSQDMGQSAYWCILFAIYEPGVRLPGFADSMESGKGDMSKLKDGTDAGMMTLLNWMDDGIELILRERTIPGTDLALEDDNFMYSLYTDQSFVVDRRPYYYGFLNVEFKGYASPGNDHGKPTRAARLLDGLD